MSMPSYGQRSDPRAAPDCPRHPGVRSVDYCKRCNRPMCVDCAIPTEVRAICVDCTSSKKRWMGSASRAAAAGAPVVTYAMMAICVFMYLVTSVSPSLKASLSLLPATLMTHPWTVLTGAFLHGGIMHILFNMLSLYWVGRAIEPVLGRWRFLTLYLVFGRFGAVFVLQRLGGSDTTAILTLLGINLVYGFMVSGISWQGHIGGAIAGVGATWVLVRMARPRAGVTQVYQNRRETVVALGMIVGMIVINALSFRVLVEVYGA